MESLRHCGTSGPVARRMRRRRPGGANTGFVAGCSGAIARERTHDFGEPQPADDASTDVGGLPPIGTWQYVVAADDFVAAGYPADVNHPGTYTLTLADGRAALEQKGDDGRRTAKPTSRRQNGHVRFSYDPAGGDCGDLVEVVDWQLADDGLHLTLVSTTGGYKESQRAQLEVKPWQLVESSASSVVPGMVDIGGHRFSSSAGGLAAPPSSSSPVRRCREPPCAASRTLCWTKDRSALRLRPCRRGAERPCRRATERHRRGRRPPALLEAAEIEAPYVLVGHSLGGDQTWLYADRHPIGVGGFMLMNAGFFEPDWDSLHDVWSQAEIDEERAH